MIARLAQSAVAGVIAIGACLVLGALLDLVDLAATAIIAGFLTRWAVVIGVLVAVAWFFGGGSWRVWARGRE